MLKCLGYGALFPCLSLLLCLPVYSQTDRQEESAEYYQKWLREDALYIITGEERDVFFNLSTDEERENFIEQFWKRRDTDPETAFNEFKEEHYRRIQYANDHFSSGIPGWKTDRGLVYVKFGEPDRIMSNPTGGQYNRPYWEGGGSTSTFPFEVWEYRDISGVGQDVELEFVDTTLSGAYDLTMNPHEKDALLYAAGAGLTYTELRGMSSKVDRIARKTSPTPGNNPILLGYGRTKDQPFQKLDLLGKVLKPPDVVERTLQSFVDSTVHYQRFPVQVKNYFIPVSAEASQVRVGVEVENRHLQFRDQGPFFESAVEILGRVSNLSREVVQTFSEEVRAQIPKERFQAALTNSAMFLKSVELRPGRYKLDLVVHDQQGDQIGVSESLILVPQLQPDDLELAPLILAKSLLMLPEAAQNQSDDPFNFGRVRLHPSLDNAFQPQEIPVYFKVYNFAPDQASGRGLVRLSYALQSAGNTVWEETEQVEPKPDQSGAFAMVKLLPGLDLTQGRYLLKILVEDQLNSRSVEKQISFSIDSL